MDPFNPTLATETITAALTGPAGPGLVLAVFATLPGVTHTPAKRTLFRSDPERLQIGPWRYELNPDGRLRATHIVNNIILTTQILTPETTAPHLTHSLHTLIQSHGPTTLPQIQAALEVLSTTP